MSITKNSETYKRGEHPNSIKNIKPHQYQKGQSGNLGGRPRKNEALRKELIKLSQQEWKVTHTQVQPWNQDILEDVTTIVRSGQRISQLAHTIWNKAIEGDIRCIGILLELDVCA
tara:strand:+ start:2019 stop:2363 length:345 start_codon:yes stop_codon:yes gene_type:complete